MNDGTAIVLFSLFKDLYLHGLEYSDSAYTPGEIVATAARMALGGPALGALFGLLGLACITLTSNKYEEDDTILQITATLATAFLAFYLGEHVSGVSGVLCTCTAAVVLAEYAWPIINSRETMGHFWHLCEARS